MRKVACPPSDSIESSATEMARKGTNVPTFAVVSRGPTGVAPDIDERFNMRNTSRLILALGTAAVIAAGASAFTATSTIDNAAVHVGSVAQSVSGATITNVVHSYTPESDTTTAISAKAEELLSTVPGVVQVSINGGALEPCTVTQTDANTNGIDDGAMDYSDIACDIADTTNVTSIRFVVNG
jgi:hypothetical protein